MKVTLPMILQDQALSGVQEEVDEFVAHEAYFLDGPVTERVAILDFDEKSGELAPGAKFVVRPRTKQGDIEGEYRISLEEPLVYHQGGEKRYKIETRTFNQVNVLGIVLKTMYLFEDDEVLGRRLRWAFDSPQLLVVPRAGEWDNAFYQRETNSLQFFYFPTFAGDQAPETSSRMVYTSLSRDIVAHETAHAILDGIAPDLYHATTPQSLAFHEALADLTAVLMASNSWPLRRAVLDKTAGQIDRSNELSQIAEEFGQHRGSEALRVLSAQEHEKPRKLQGASIEPHSLSLVLSSALFAVMTHLFHERWETQIPVTTWLEAERNKKWYKGPRDAAMFRALDIATEEFKSMIYGALDYVPPGEVSFADYGRAIIAAQHNLTQVEALPERERERAQKRIRFLIQVFSERGIFSRTQEEDDHTTQTIKIDAEKSSASVHLPELAFTEEELTNLLNSDYVAYQFAKDSADMLGIPEDTPFKVLPRFTATKILYNPKSWWNWNRNLPESLRNSPNNVVRQRQLFFKVSWTKTEPMDVKDTSLPPGRRVTAGSTLVVDLDQRRVIALLYTDESAHLRRERDQMINLLLQKDLLRFGQLAIGPDNRPLSSVVQGEKTAEHLQIKGMARMLHIASWDREPGH